MTYFLGFGEAIQFAQRQLMVYGQDVNSGRWQGVPTEGKPDLRTRELMNLTLDVPVARRIVRRDEDFSPLEQLRHEIQPNLPWADDHFAERVSRVPSNPGEEYRNWPWWTPEKEEYTHALEATRAEFKFTHTYQERFWPKQAGYTETGPPHYTGNPPREGIRYQYGDLDDVVTLLFEDPYTRQATFPIFFPEDTGAVHRGRIPCTLHYHFLLRNKKLHMWYAIRSCDFVRHFRDDLYMACRLLLWVLQELVERELRSGKEQLWIDVDPGMLHFTAYSFHVHYGDMHHVEN